MRSLQAIRPERGSLQFDEKIRQSWVGAEMRPVQHVHQAFKYGLVRRPGVRWIADADQRLVDTPGRSERAGTSAHAPARCSRGIAMPQPELKPDRQLTFDKLTNVHFSGTRHEEDQPSHLLVHTEVCHTICGKEYGHPCIRFCPANVYEIVADDGRAAPADQRIELRALQDVRHHGPLSGDYVGAAGRRRRAAVRRHVSGWRGAESGVRADDGVSG